MGFFKSGSLIFVVSLVNAVGSTNKLRPGLDTQLASFLIKADAGAVCMEKLWASNHSALLLTTEI